MTKKMVHGINKQIQEELDSAYLYLALSAHMDAKNLKGCAHWLRLQWEEELVHALKLYDFLLQRDAPVTLLPLRQPAFEADTPLEVFSLALKHEQHITRCINELYALAVVEDDYASQTLLQWFVTEQLEEEENARTLMEDLALAGSHGASLLLLDRELAARVEEEDD